MIAAPRSFPISILSLKSNILSKLVFATPMRLYYVCLYIYALYSIVSMF